MKISKITDVINELNNLQINPLTGLFIYPVFISEINHSAKSMLDLTEYLIYYSKVDFVEESIKNLENFTNEGFQQSINDFLQSRGQQPPLTPSPIYKRKKLNVGDTPRNIITGAYIKCFGLGFSKIEPADIPTNWIRQL